MKINIAFQKEITNRKENFWSKGYKFIGGISAFPLAFAFSKSII